MITTLSFIWLHMLHCTVVITLGNLPYSGKLSREKTFVFFAFSEPSVNVFSAKFCNPQCAHCMYAGALRMREGHTYIIIGLEQPVKVFSAKFSFCTETRTKVFSLKSFPLYGTLIPKLLLPCAYDTMIMLFYY